MGQILKLTYESATDTFTEVTSAANVFSNLDGYSGDNKTVTFRVQVAEDVNVAALSYKNVFVKFFGVVNSTEIPLNQLTGSYVSNDLVHNGKVSFGVSKAGINITPDTNGMYFLTDVLNTTTTFVEFEIKELITARLINDYGTALKINNIFVKVYAIPVAA